jgi:DNA-binding transcriptional MerR regulator
MVMTNPELIEAREVAEVLNISIPSLRDYRKRGLIIVAAKRGNTDLYDKGDVLRRYSIIREKRGQGFSLSQISQMLSKEKSNVIDVCGPQEPTGQMNDQELLHGFLTELYRKATPETKAYVDELCRKWNVRFRAQSE